MRATCQVRKTSAFEGACSEELNRIEGCRSCFYFNKGQTLFQEGICARGVYCIYSGKLKVSRVGLNGKEQIIRFGKPSDFVGYRSIINQEHVWTNIITTIFMARIG